MGKILDLTDQTFGRLTVLQRDGTRSYNGHATHALWACRCICGNAYSTSTSALRNGSVRSCGCLRRKALQPIKIRPEHLEALTALATARSVTIRQLIDAIMTQGLRALQRSSIVP